MERDQELSTADLAGHRPSAQEADDLPGVPPAEDRADPADPPTRPDPDPEPDPDRDRDRDPGTDADRGAGRADAEDVSLVPDERGEALRSRWNDVQARFVDDPKQAVAEADALVAELMQELAGEFAARKAALEGRWSGGHDVETEELRRALRSYRSFFNRLLST